MPSAVVNSQVRTSNGLFEFCTSLEERPGLAILDLAPANQATISFITNYGHKIYSEDFLEQLDECFRPGVLEGASSNPLENHSNPLLVSRLFESALPFPENSFDGILAWDALEYMGPALLGSVVERLHRMLRPGAPLLAFFHSEALQPDGTPTPVQTYAYRIQDSRNLQMNPRPRRPLAQVFNNRTLERLFQDFDSVKFFLTRDNLREVIVRK